MKKIVPSQIIFVLVILGLISLAFYYSHPKTIINPLKENKYGFKMRSIGEDQDEYIRSQMNICYKNGLDDCYKSVVDLFLAQFSYSDVLDSFQNNEEYPEIFSRCHEATHFIGRLAYEGDPSVPDLYSHGNSACWGGFYHGVIEGYFGSKHLNPNDPNDPRVLAEINNVCGKLADYKSPRFFSECLHGIGHALMFITVSDLPKSLTWCDKLPNLDQRETCYSGVFMENSSSSTSVDHPSKYIKAQDPFYPCDSLDSKYLTVCYRYQSSYFARITNFDWQKNADLCAEVPKPYDLGCFLIIGSNQVGKTQSLSSMYETCKLMSSEETKKQCVGGVVSGLGGRYIFEPEKMAEFCNLVSKDLSQLCWTSYGGSISGWYSSNSMPKNSCSLDTEEKSSWCRQGLSMTQEAVINK